MNYFLPLALILFIYMSFWFMLSLLKKRNDVADVAWGLGFVLMAWTSFFLGQIGSVRGILVGILLSVWGFRLAWYIYTRNRGKAEDYRYFEWRERWGKWFYIRSYAQVYLLQGFFLFLIVSPVLLINSSTGSTLELLDFFGVVVWLVGFYFEAMGDAQLARFIKDPTNKGKLMQSGLWRYTRHPNYFGEVTMWWGIWIISLSTSYNLLSVIGPLTITFLILKVSGIPMLEEKYEGRLDFEEYKRKTSIFFPLPPKKTYRSIDKIEKVY